MPRRRATKLLLGERIHEMRSGKINQKLVIINFFLEFKICCLSYLLLIKVSRLVPSEFVYECLLRV